MPDSGQNSCGPFSAREEIELRVETLTNLGHGLGRHGGWVVMVPFALPGERVRARVFRNHKNYSEADLLEILQPSPDRVEPRCELFGQCGGCQLQNLAYPAQLEWKRRQMVELLEHLAGVQFPVEPVAGSPEPYGYRTKLTPHFDRPRDGQIGPIGFLKAGRRFELIDVPQCPIATPAINAALPRVRKEVRADAARYRSGATLLLREGVAGVTTDPGQEIAERIGDLELRFLARDFFQNNPFLLPELIDHVAGETGGTGARFLVDAYCGSGLFALACARRFDRVCGIEISETSVARAQENARRNGIGNCDFLVGDAASIFGGVRFSGAETAVVIDPPRKGCSTDFLDQILGFRPAGAVYVSCNPATQMRDLKRFLEAGYGLQRVRPFDLFPQTKHLECVITLVAGV